MFLEVPRNGGKLCLPLDKADEGSPARSVGNG